MCIGIVDIFVCQTDFAILRYTFNNIDGLDTCFCRYIMGHSTVDNLASVFPPASYSLVVVTALAWRDVEVQTFRWAPPSEFVSSSIPSWQILTAHAQPFRGARDLAFCLKVPLDSLLVWASSEGSGETARMRRLAWTFAARIGYKYQIRLTRPRSFVI